MSYHETPNTQIHDNDVVISPKSGDRFSIDCDVCYIENMTGGSVNLHGRTLAVIDTQTGGTITCYHESSIISEHIKRGRIIANGTSRIEINTVLDGDIRLNDDATLHITEQQNSAISCYNSAIVYSRVNIQDTVMLNDNSKYCFLSKEYTRNKCILIYNGNPTNIIPSKEISEWLSVVQLKPLMLLIKDSCNNRPQIELIVYLINGGLSISIMCLINGHLESKTYHYFDFDIDAYLGNNYKNKGQIDAIKAEFRLLEDRYYYS